MSRRPIGSVLSARPVIESLDARRLLAAASFSTTTGFTANSPRAIATADINGDNRADLVIANDASPAISVLLGNGSGTFAAPANLSPFFGRRSVVAVDLNGDGKADLATGGSGGVSVLLGNGDGTFAAGLNHPVGSSPEVMVSGDFNQDGKTDLATTNFYGGTTSVLLGDGAGGFSVSTVANASGTSIVSGDFNTDGKTDLAIGSGGVVAILLGSGTGTFSAPSTSAVQSASYVSTNDFNGDGKADLFATGTSGTGSVLLGNGNGTFASPITVQSTTSQTPAIALDLNNDGRIDLATVTSTSISVLYGFGNGNFYGSGPFTPVVSPAYASLTCLISGDFNGDGQTDLAGAGTATASGSYVGQILPGNGDGTFGAKFVPTGSTSTYAAATGDFNGDGRADLASVNRGSNTVSIKLGNGDGYGSATNVTVGSAPYAVTAADFNGDGKLDLATANNGSGTASLLYGNGNGTFAAAVAVPFGMNPVGIISADFNNDGRPDLAEADSYYTGFVSVILNNGDGTFRGGSAWANAGTKALASADFNNDGNADLVTAQNNLISIALGNGAGSFSTGAGALVGTSFFSNATGLAAGDFDGDGKADIIVADPRTFWAVAGNGDGTFASPTPIQAIYSSTGLGATLNSGEVNGDGRLDVLAVEGGSGVAILRNTSNLTTGAIAVTSDHAVADAGQAVTLTATITRASGTPTGGTVQFMDGTTALGGPAPVNDGTATLTTSLLAFGYHFITAVYGDAAGFITSTTALKQGIRGTVAAGGTSPPNTIGVGGNYLSVTAQNTVKTYPLALVSNLSLSGPGQITVNADLGLASGANGVGLTVASSARSVLFTTSQHLTTLTLNGTITFATGGNKLLRANSITFGPIGRLDLSDNSLVYDYTAATPQADAIRGLIAAARNAGAWNGPGLTSSTAGLNTAASTTLGYLEATDYKSLYGSTATFAGEILDDTAVVVGYTLYGDTDLDRGVSINDFNRLSGAFGAAVRKSWLDGDVDDDGGVSINDFNLLSSNFGKTLAIPALMPLTRRGVAPAKS